jgi:hypothetical protein
VGAVGAAIGAGAGIPDPNLINLKSRLTLSTIQYNLGSASLLIYVKDFLVLDDARV